MKAKLAREICLELSVHTTIEEELFYPAIKETVEEEIYDEAYVEHDGAKVLIAEILEGTPDDDFYDAKVKVLSEMIKHHVKEEEQRGGMFAQAQGRRRRRSGGARYGHARAQEGARGEHEERRRADAGDAFDEGCRAGTRDASCVGRVCQSQTSRSSHGTHVIQEVDLAKSPSRKSALAGGGETHQQVADGKAATAYLTTNHGTRISDNQNSLRLGTRGPTLLEDFILREKIFHFDHERIPGAHRARPRLGCARLLRMHARHSRADARHGVREEGQAHAGVLPLLDGGGLEGLEGHAARCPRLRGQVLLGRRQLGPGRQQHSGVLHPGCDQVPGPHPCREAGGGPRLSAGGLGARHVLGLRVADAREHAHDHVGDVGSRASAVAAHDGRLRRAHVPVRQRGGRVALREVPLAAAPGHAVHAVGRGGQDLRRRSRLSPARPVGGDHVGQSAGMGPGRAGVRRGVRRRAALRRARCDQAHPGGGRAADDRRPSRARSLAGQLLRGNGAGRVPAVERDSRASTSPTIRCCRAASSPTSTRRSRGSAPPISIRFRSTRRSARSRISSATG